MLNDLKWKQDEKCRKMCLLCEDTYRLAANWSQGAEREKYRLLGTASQDTLVFNFNWEAFSSRIGNLSVPVFCITCWSWTSHERHLAESTQFATCNIWLLKEPVVRRPRAVPKGGKGADSRRPPRASRTSNTSGKHLNFHQIQKDFVVPFFFWLDSFLDSLFPFFLKLRQDFTHRDSCCQAAPHVVRLDASRCGVTLGLRAFLEKTDGESNDFWGLQSLPDAQVWRNQLFLKAQEIKLGKFTELRLWTCSQSLSVWRCSCCIKTVWLRQGPKWIRLKDGGKLLASQKFPLIRLGFHIFFMFHPEVDWCRDGMLCTCGWDGALWSNGNLRVFFSKGRAVEDFEALKHLEIKGDTWNAQDLIWLTVFQNPIAGRHALESLSRWWRLCFAGDPTIRSQILAHKPDILAVPVWDQGRPEGLWRDHQLMRFQHVSNKNWWRWENYVFLYAVATEDPMPKPNQIS